MCNIFAPSFRNRKIYGFWRALVCSRWLCSSLLWNCVASPLFSVPLASSSAIGAAPALYAAHPSSDANSIFLLLMLQQLLLSLPCRVPCPSSCLCMLPMPIQVCFTLACQLLPPYPQQWLQRAGVANSKEQKLSKAWITLLAQEPQVQVDLHSPNSAFWPLIQRTIMPDFFYAYCRFPRTRLDYRVFSPSLRAAPSLSSQVRTCAVSWELEVPGMELGDISFYLFKLSAL